MRNKQFEKAVQVSGQRFRRKFKHSLESFEGLIRQIGFTIDINNVSKQGRVDGVLFRLEAHEEVLHERELPSTTKFKDQNVEGRVRVLEIGLTGS